MRPLGALKKQRTGGEPILCLFSLKSELKQGRDEDAAAFAEALAARFQLVPEPKSKLKRALELAEEKT